MWRGCFLPQFSALDALDDVDEALVGAGVDADLFASRTTKPFRNSISVRRPLAMSWPIDGR